ncbi:Putative SOS response-associated peptidase YedK [Oceanospirillum multiglobuliferum]|uniref:Abasic site processing protein n=1 Tax=Oceanospirillum multiglobuliferum TaxID=64969 RepID=A0A1T4S1E8_9GAMM|nr:SOS response-associated peptidase [Oceanospirillum multiglobuliferum]OPX54518.1 hypothetical protein BTE48_13575 [Oceanospirillum multiglobuliferum]SKA21906.1 Putative SOS response-associated peptidase YedK [Oceanospirillum multiglobuliferum]
MTGRLIITPCNLDSFLHSAVQINDALITSYNMAPRNFVSILRLKDDRLTLDKGYWGYSPTWLKVLEHAPYAARVESLHEKPMFKNALSQRCLIPCSGYYEWMQFSRQKRAFAVRRPDNRAFLIAGIWTRYPTSEHTFYDTFALLTTPSNDALIRISERMPVIIEPDDASHWLGNLSNTDLTNTIANDHFDCYPVSTLVNNPSNQSRAVTEPIGQRFRFQ